MGITLTVRNSTGRKMAGFPYHALDTYLPKLIRAGHRVAICDQLEEPKVRSSESSGKLACTMPSRAGLAAELKGSAKVVEMVEPASKKRSSKKASEAECPEL